MSDDKGGGGDDYDPFNDYGGSGGSAIGANGEYEGNNPYYGKDPASFGSSVVAPDAGAAPSLGGGDLGSPPTLGTGDYGGSTDSLVTAAGPTAFPDQWNDPPGNDILPTSATAVSNNQSKEASSLSPSNWTGWTDDAGNGGTFSPMATPTSGPSLPAGTESWNAQQNYYSPPGASGTPALNTSGASDAPLSALATTPGTGAGPSAGGDVLGIGGGTAHGTGGDLTAAGKGKDDSNWLDALKIKNPLGVGMAAAGMGYNMLQGQQTSAAATNLATLAGPAMAQGAEMSARGREVGEQGISDLRTRAATLDPNAKTLQDKGTDLTKYVGTGTLPPELQTQVTEAANNAKTKIISGYASRGMPVDPARNSSLREELAAVDRQAVIMSGTLAQQLAQTGTTIYGAGVGGTTAGGNLQKSAADIGTGFVNAGIQQSGLASNTYKALADIDQQQTANTQKAIAAMAAALSGGSGNGKGGTTINIPGLG